MYLYYYVMHVFKIFVHLSWHNKYYPKYIFYNIHVFKESKMKRQNVLIYE